MCIDDPYLRPGDYTTDYDSSEERIFQSFVLSVDRQVQFSETAAVLLFGEIVITCMTRSEIRSLLKLCQQLNTELRLVNARFDDLPFQKIQLDGC